MSKKPPLSPILKAMRENLNFELKSLEHRATAIDLITNNRPVAQVLVEAFQAAQASQDEVDRYVLADHQPDPKPVIIARRLMTEQLFCGETVDLGNGIVVQLTREAVGFAYDFIKDALAAGEADQHAGNEPIAATTYITIEAIERLLNGLPVDPAGLFTRLRLDPTVEPMSFKIVSADTPIIAADPETPEEIEEHRAEVIETIQEARGQEPEAFKPDPEDPVDDIAYEVETMSEEEATASIEEPYEAELVMPRREEPEPEKPKRLVPREVPAATDKQAETDEKLTAHLEVATKRSGTDQMLFDRASLAQMIHESEVRTSASLLRLQGKGIITPNPDAPKGHVSFTFNGRK